MQNKDTLVTMSLGEVDTLLFEILTAEFKMMYPNDHRTALRAAMHVCDKVIIPFESIAARQAKRAAATRLPQQAPNGQPGADPAPQAPAAPAAPRPRRTKAQMEADRAAVAAAAAAQAPPPQPVAAAPAAPQPVPMGQPFSEPFPATAQPQPLGPPLQTTAPAPVQSAPPPPPQPIDNFADLARQAAAQGVPQFAPAASPAPVPAAPTPAAPAPFTPPPPTFG